MKINKFLTNDEDKLKEYFKGNEKSTFLENIDKERHLYPQSTKVFDDVSNFFFLDKESHENISLISSKFLLSSFILEYLKLLNNLVNTKYDISQLTLSDFENNGKIEEVIEKISESQNEPLINWLRDECLTELSSAIDNFIVDDIKKLNKLGHIIKLTTNELQDNKEIQDIELYDTLYRFINRLNNFELDRKKHDITLKYSNIKKSKEGHSVEINYELKFWNENIPAVKQIMRELTYQGV